MSGEALELVHYAVFECQEGRLVVREVHELDRVAVGLAHEDLRSRSTVKGVQLLNRTQSLVRQSPSPCEPTLCPLNNLSTCARGTLGGAWGGALCDGGGPTTEDFGAGLGNTEDFGAGVGRT